MARHVLRLVVLSALVFAPGCVRIPFDLCDDADAHPDCLTLDGGADVTDAPPADSGDSG